MITYKNCREALHFCPFPKAVLKLRGCKRVSRAFSAEAVTEGIEEALNLLFHWTDHITWTIPFFPSRFCNNTWVEKRQWFGVTLYIHDVTATLIISLTNSYNQIFEPTSDHIDSVYWWVGSKSVFITSSPRCSSYIQAWEPFSKKRTGIHHEKGTVARAHKY